MKLPAAIATSLVVSALMMAAVACTSGGASESQTTPTPTTQRVQTPSGQVPGAGELVAECFHTEAEPLPLTFDVGNEPAPTGFDGSNSAGCRFSKPIAKVSVTLRNGHGSVRGETFFVDPPSDDLSFPLPAGLLSETTLELLRPGDYQREMVAIAEDGETWDITANLAAALKTVTVLGDSDSIPPTTTSTLQGTEWVLISLNGKSLIEGTNITLSFAEGSLGGFTGCNAYGGKYIATDDGTLTVPEIEVTAMRCTAPEGVMEQQAAYTSALQDAATYRVMDDHLKIDNAAGQTALVFARKEEYPMDPKRLVGTKWQLLSWDGNSPLEGSTITLAFHNEYRVGGLAGCRGYVATYEASGDNIEFPMLAMTGSYEHCTEGLMRQEGEYTDSLQWATDYHLSEEPAPNGSKGQLEILTARGEVLLFEPLPEHADVSLRGSTWVLTAFIKEKRVEEMSTPALITIDLWAETEITATFEDGTVRGSAGCNTYSAAYTLDDSFLKIETPAATKMACLNPTGVMEQEGRYLSFLRDVTAYRIYGGQFRLETDDGRNLVFVAQE